MPQPPPRPEYVNQVLAGRVLGRPSLFYMLFNYIPARLATGFNMLAESIDSFLSSRKRLINNLVSFYFAK